MYHKIREAQQGDREEGFTLIELLVVVIIIGILAAIAIPVFLNQRQKAWDSAAKSDLRNAATAQESYFTEESHYAFDDDFTDGVGLDAEGYNNSDNITLTVVTPANDTAAASATTYCMEAFHTSNTANVWKLDSSSGAPVLTTDAGVTDCSGS